MNLLAPLALGLLFPLAANAGTLTVGPAPGPGIDFTSIQAAINAAAEGDTVVVQTGGYLEFVHIDGKSIDLIGQGHVVVFLSTLSPTGGPMLHIENLVPGQKVHVSGIQVDRITGLPGAAIQIESNAGRVWIEDCGVDTYDGHAMFVTSSTDVVLSDVFLQSNVADQDAMGLIHPSNGLLVEAGSVVHAYKIQATGSHGPPLFGTVTAPIPGGHGVQVVDSTLRLIESDLSAGSGGSFFSGGCSSGASGGSALAVFAQGGPAPSVEFRGGTWHAGISGSFTPGCGPAPLTAPLIADPTGAVTQLQGKSRTLAMPALATPLGTLEFQLVGGKSDLFLLFASPHSSSATPLSGIDGDLFLDPSSAFIVTSGALDSLGFGGNILTFANQGPPITVRTQALFLDTTGGLWFSGPGSIYFE